MHHPSLLTHLWGPCVKGNGSMLHFPRLGGQECPLFKEELRLEGGNPIETEWDRHTVVPIGIIHGKQPGQRRGSLPQCGQLSRALPGRKESDMIPDRRPDVDIH